MKKWKKRNWKARNIKLLALGSADIFADIQKEKFTGNKVISVSLQAITSSGLWTLVGNKAMSKLLFEYESLYVACHNWTMIFQLSLSWNELHCTHLIFKVGDLIQFATSFLFWICLLSFGLFCGVYTRDYGFDSDSHPWNVQENFPAESPFVVHFAPHPRLWQGTPDFFGLCPLLYVKREGKWSVLKKNSLRSVESRICVQVMKSQDKSCHLPETQKIPIEAPRMIICEIPS